MNALIEVIDAGEALHDVSVYVHPDLPAHCAAVGLHFGDKIVCIQAEPDNDTIRIHVGLPTGLLKLPHVSPNSPWDRALRAKILWAWRMINHQGYEDGCQIAFSDPSTGVIRIVIQLIVEASSIEISVVTIVTTAG